MPSVLNSQILWFESSLEFESKQRLMHQTVHDPVDDTFFLLACHVLLLQARGDIEPPALVEFSSTTTTTTTTAVRVELSDDPVDKLILSIEVSGAVILLKPSSQRILCTSTDGH